MRERGKLFERRMRGASQKLSGVAGRCSQYKIESGCVQVWRSGARNLRTINLEVDRPSRVRVRGVAVKVGEDIIRGPDRCAFFHLEGIEYDLQSKHVARGERAEAQMKRSYTDYSIQDEV